MTQSPDVLGETFDLGELVFPVHPAFNICPTQEIAVVREANNRRELVPMRWGLVPGWARDPSIGNKLFNARGETVAEKPSFRQAFRSRRCLVPADAFYEWEKLGKARRPWCFRMARAPRLFAFAGLWERWRGPEGSEVESCAIVTTAANAFIAPIHDRMPVILRRDEFNAWLRGNPDEAGGLIRPLPEGVLEKFECRPENAQAGPVAGIDQPELL